MAFSYDWYKELISIAKSNYEIKDWNDACDGIIIRHDIDYDLKKAYEFAIFEESLGVRSTYFLQLSGDFYNVFSHDGKRFINGIRKAGHKIGLHFDETIYADCHEKDCFIEKIIWESNILSEVAGEQVNVVSMHRPSEQMLNWDIEIPNMFNAYSKAFFSNYKYYSDSRRMWREPVIEDLQEKKHKNIQLLTHPFWYMENEMDMHKTLVDFVNSANQERYDYLKCNFSNLNKVVSKEEVLGN